jgi:phosphoribosylformylglycinamidine cyclo-ligase
MAKSSSQTGPKLTGGVKYGDIDPYKVDCQHEARKTGHNIRRLGYELLEWSRGESVVLYRDPHGQIIGHVDEGLGTKNQVIVSMANQLGRIAQSVGTNANFVRTFYDSLAQCTVAMIVNDMITLGVLPVSVNQHLAVGSEDWFKNKARARDLIKGWRNACDMARCAWGGGETPSLKGIVNPTTPVMAGSAFGVAMMKNGKLAIDPRRIRGGDHIVILHSSGVHANGLTLARKIGDNLKKLPQGYLTPLSDKTPFGVALLTPTHIYVGFVEDAINAGVDIRYGVNVTGHGWGKLMRPERPFTYLIKNRPPVHPVFQFIGVHNPKGPMSLQDLYGAYNMGAGFALYVPRRHVNKVMELANSGRYPFGATDAGEIIDNGRKAVEFEKIDVHFDEKDLDLRG